MRNRIGIVLGTLAGVIGAGIGIYFAAFSPSGRPYNLQGTLPKMVADFGAGARVVQLVVSADNVDFEVIPDDGRLHTRNYDLVSSEIEPAPPEPTA